jgi:SAM-dependent methyltransferase
MMSITSVQKPSAASNRSGFFRSPFFRGIKNALLGNRLARRLMTRNFTCGRVALGERNSYTFPMGWITVDWRDADFPIWISQDVKLPFASASQSVFYSAHMMEHLETPTLRLLLQEIARVLKPGGALRVEVPDAQLLVDALHNNDRKVLDYLRQGREELVQSRDFMGLEYLEDHITVLGEIANYIQRDIDIRHVPVYATRAEFDRELAKGMESFNDWAQSLKTPQQRTSGGHANALTFDKMKSLLLEAGFREVRRSHIGQTDIPGLKLGRGPARIYDSVPEVPSRAVYSLYLEAFR